MANIVAFLEFNIDAITQLQFWLLYYIPHNACKSVSLPDVIFCFNLSRMLCYLDQNRFFSVVFFKMLGVNSFKKKKNQPLK